MKDFVKELIRYFKLTFKFFYWLINLIFFLFCLCYLSLKKAKSKPLFSYKEEVLCVSYVAISFDGRIKKTANEIMNLGFPVSLIKPYDAIEDLESEFSGIHNKVTIKPLGLSGSFSYFPCVFDFLITLYLIFSKKRFIHCHDINTAFMGLVASKVTGKTLISDLHEWKSETTNVNSKSQNSLQQIIFNLIENMVVRESDFVITVNDEIAKHLKQSAKTTRGIFIVKNCPNSIELQEYDLRSRLNISREYIIGYYVGQMAPYRNLDLIVKAMQLFPRICLVFQGTISEEYRNDLKKIDTSNRLFFLPPVRYDLIPSYCQGADFGIFSCSIKSKSMYYSLPNKFFEYIAGGIPILSEDIPLMRKYLKKYKIGTMFESNNIDTINKSFDFILDTDNLSNMKNHIMNLRENLIYEVNTGNSLVYKNIYIKGKKQFI